VAAVADVYDALSSPRPYRPGWLVERVLEHITDGAGVLFDSAVTDALVRVVEAGVIQSPGMNGAPSPAVLREESLGTSGMQNAVSLPRLAPVSGR
jgi:putative two-component system response regulator